MLDNVFYLYCRFKGTDADRYFTNNKNYLLEVRVGRFNKRVKIAHIHGYGNQKYIESVRRYNDQASFERSWKVIKDVTEETADGGGGPAKGVPTTRKEMRDLKKHL